MSFASWALCGALIGCGSSTDEPVVDASPDPDAPLVGPVEVTVLESFVDQTPTGAPDPTAIVIFRDADGEVVQHGPVDAAGTATASMSGGSVTVVQVQTVNATRRSLVTHIRAVKPNDHLHVGVSRSPGSHDGEMTRMDATYTPFAVPDQGIGAVSACGGGSQPQPANGIFRLQFFEGCRQQTFSVLALADSGNQFVWKPNNTYAANGAIELPNTWQPMGQALVSFSNAPPQTTSISSELQLFVDDVATRFDSAGIDLATSSTLQLRYPPGAGTRSKLVTLVGHAGLVDQFISVHPTLDTTQTIDLGTFPLPELPARSQHSATGVEWTQTFAGTPDIRYVAWFARASSAALEHEYSISIVEPPDGPASSALPALPAEYYLDDATSVPAEDLRFDPFTRSSVVYLDYDAIDGYDAARQFSNSDLVGLSDVGLHGRIRGTP